MRTGSVTSTPQRSAWIMCSALGSTCRHVILASARSAITLFRHGFLTCPLVQPLAVDTIASIDHPTSSAVDPVESPCGSPYLVVHATSIEASKGAVARYNGLLQLTLLAVHSRRMSERALASKLKDQHDIDVYNFYCLRCCTSPVFTCSIREMRRTGMRDL